MRNADTADGGQGARSVETTRGTPAGVPADGGGPTPLVDTLHEVLADRKQRRLLYHLVANGEAGAETLVDVLETAGPNGPSRSELRDELKETLLPPMLEADIISIDSERGVVQLQFLPHDVLEWLQTERRNDHA